MNKVKTEIFFELILAQTRNNSWPDLSAISAQISEKTLFLKHVSVLFNPCQLIKSKCLLSSNIVCFSHLYFIFPTIINLTSMLI